MSLEDELNGIGDYYDGHPEPPEEPVSDQARAEYAAAMGDWESGFGEDGPPEPPSPPDIPGPPSPGAGMPAARATDMTAHGGTIGPVVTGLAAKVFIGFLPAACQGDPQICPMFDGPKPHVGGTITKGSSSVNIGGKPAARVSDPTECKGPPGTVALGDFSVMIGDIGGGAAASAAAGAAAAGAARTETAPAGRAHEPVPVSAAEKEDIAQVEAAYTRAAEAGTPLVERCKPCSLV